MTRLKRCPFCGRRPALYDGTIDCDYAINNPMAWVTCACGIETKAAKSRGYVTALWNRRKSQPDREPCQECGISPRIVMNGNTGEARYECPNCHEHSDWYEDEGDAADAWNRRNR